MTRLSLALTYVDDAKKFASKIDWHQNLQEIESQTEEDRRYGFHPSFYIRETSDRHPKFGTVRTWELGLVTSEALRRSVHWLDDRKYVPVAKLPDALFNDYYAGHNFTLNLNVSDDVPALLLYYGWQASERDSDSPRTAIEIKHEYITVWYDGI